MMEPLRMRGLVAAVVTPMNAKGDLDLSVVPRVVDYLASKGITGIYIAGSTGEGMSLTDEERRGVAEAYVGAAKGRMKSFVQVGHNSLRASADLAGHAESIGADAVSATPTGYFKVSGEAELVEGLLPIVEAAPKTPFYYYHIPFLSGVNLDPIKLTDISMDRLPTFCGIKYSDGASLHNLPLLESVAPGLEFLSGSDEAYLMSVAQGYKAAVGSTYNYAAPIYNNVRKSLSVGDFKRAQVWQKHALEMITAMFETCGRSSLKVMMQMVGIDCGPVRRPIDPASPDQIIALRKRLDTMGWFEWIKEDLSAEIS
ncbi:MAG: N-acetylneuraminate lyase [Verrucomicrobia bacterium]|jgi:N-acetylneuraminate lyase|nr:N-acetylneuraminate lyase [Verrucomicrobiota bacterium]MBT7969637.1 N-acetylneuraminate lyase [Verrucomicrobiota bacterium]